MEDLPRRIAALQERGVEIPAPHSIELAPEVPLEAIAPGVRLHRGCRIAGARTSLGPGCVLGAEAPMTVVDCCLGHQVELKGGYAEGAVLLDGASLGSATHVRPGTLLEEEANGAHAVGLKQTIFFPWVTAGSLINFCDVLMTGGTSRKHHGEIGSSYIHFNYTPRGDKATASLLGDVPTGVMLRSDPIFLGGQGGLVGPVHLPCGSVIPAGLIRRQDADQPNQLLAGSPALPGGDRPFAADHYRKVDRIFTLGIRYLGQLRALQAWYEQARPHTMDHDPWRAACRQAALQALELVCQERLKRLDEVARRLPESAKAEAAAGNQTGAERLRQWHTAWERAAPTLHIPPAPATGAPAREVFLVAWTAITADTKCHLDAVRALPPEACAAATAWLTEIAATVARLAVP